MDVWLDEGARQKQRKLKHEPKIELNKTHIHSRLVSGWIFSRGRGHVVYLYKISVLMKAYSGKENLKAMGQCSYYVACPLECFFALF